jgi:hypothetical protein
LVNKPEKGTNTLSQAKSAKRNTYSDHLKTRHLKTGTRKNQTLVFKWLNQPFWILLFEIWTKVQNIVQWGSENRTYEYRTRFHMVGNFCQPFCFNHLKTGLVFKWHLKTRPISSSQQLNV